MAKRNDALKLLYQRLLSTRAQIGEAWAYDADPETDIWHTVPSGDWVDGHWIEK